MMTAQTVEPMFPTFATGLLSRPSKTAEAEHWPELERSSTSDYYCFGKEDMRCGTVLIF